MSTSLHGAPSHPHSPTRPGTSAVPARLMGEWQLFTDWCTATGRPALPTTGTVVQRFVEQLPAPPTVLARRIRAIRAAHHSATAPDPAPPHPPRNTPVGKQYRGNGWPDPDDVLAQLADLDYPAGVAGRRDAVIVLLCVVLGRTRRQALAAQAGVWPVTRIDDLNLRLDPDPRSCPACVLTMWLRVLAADAGGGRRLVETVVVESERAGHDCHRVVPDGWAHRPLLPRIDRHGWIDPHRPMGARSVSAALHRAMTVDRLPSGLPSPPDTAVGPLSFGRRDHQALAELDELLTRLEAQLGVAPTVEQAR